MTTLRLSVLRTDTGVLNLGIIEEGVEGPGRVGIADGDVADVRAA